LIASWRSAADELGELPPRQPLEAGRTGSQSTLRHPVALSGSSRSRLPHITR
jgi:hypothetical protein